MSRRGVATLLMLVDAGAGAALASEEAHGEHHAAGIPWGMLALQAINLLIFLWVLGRYVLPSVRTWVRERGQRVVDELQAAATAKAEAERLKAEWEARLGQLDREIEALRAQA